MARMIPPRIHADCASPGEREIFRRLKEDPAAHGWTVLHSLDVANHRSSIAGEIDFVVIVPEKG
ncbi:NERD domain-containing protein, partial [Streptococcus pseudopneumoniae]|uniref:NERD domain-containing protein n=1 Tax=Streptococcus pseudopneumoniae TaxID=257758 RepID=UPI0014860E48